MGEAYYIGILRPIRALGTFSIYSQTAQIVGILSLKGFLLCLGSDNIGGYINTLDILRPSEAHVELRRLRGCGVTVSSARLNLNSH